MSFGPKIESLQFRTEYGWTDNGKFTCGSGKVEGPDCRETDRRKRLKETWTSQRRTSSDFTVHN